MKSYQKPIARAAGATLASSLLISPSLSGAAFQLFERSASGIGTSFASGAASADDASILASNPAAMIMLGGEWNTSIGMNVVHVTAEVEGFSPNVGAGGLTLAPNNDDSVGQTSLIPMIYLTKKVTDDVVVGLGAFSTYGLVTDYSSSFADNGATNLSELISINLNPSFAWRVNDWLTLGAGLDIVYAEGELSSRSPQAVLAGPGNLFSLTGDDVAFGFNIGALIEISDQLHFGIHYRSSLELEIDGEATLGNGINNIAGGAVAIPGTYDAGLSVELPETIEASLLYKVNPQLNLHADVFWTNWDKVPRLSPTVEGTLNDAAVNAILNSDLNWENSFRFALGATYFHSEKLTLRTGVAFDESPVDDDNRTLRIPDRDRIWLSFGLSYEFYEDYRLDLGYAHLFAEDGDIDANEPFYSGEVSGSADIFSIGVSAQFD